MAMLNNQRVDGAKTVEPPTKTAWSREEYMNLYESDWIWIYLNFWEQPTTSFHWEMNIMDHFHIPIDGEIRQTESGWLVNIPSVALSKHRGDIVHTHGASRGIVQV